MTGGAFAPGGFATNFLAVLGVVGSTIIPGVALYREWDKPDESTGKITSPTRSDCDNKVKQNGTMLKGRGKIVSGDQLWIVTRPTEDKKDYVDGPVFPVKGEWKLKVTGIGGKGDKGKKFKIVLIAADAASSSQLRDSYEQGKGMTPLSEGTRVLHERCLTRTDVGK